MCLTVRSHGLVLVRGLLGRCPAGWLGLGHLSARMHVFLCSGVAVSPGQPRPVDALAP